MDHEDDTTKTWLGSSILEICNNKEVWSFNVPPINISKYHAVLFQLPVTLKELQEPHKGSDPQRWDDDHVRMPYSDKSLFPLTENGVDVIKLRWKLIQDTLLIPISNSREFEAAIHVYNSDSSLPEFIALHSYFDDMEEDESGHFFKDLLPKIISLALNLPQILPGIVPVLKQNNNRSVSLSQYQVASLLANAFLCTFPWRISTGSACPGVNFVHLFSSYNRPNMQHSLFEKFKCIFNYFRMVTSSMPVGVITFERKYVRKSDIPRWGSLNKNLSDTKVHIDSAGTIEENGLGLLQVDFANRNVGGGVLGYGCLQEEIRFVICPELIITRLFVEQLTDLEAVVVTGVQRFSKYSGYGDTFTWEGPFNDQTPYDECGRRRTSVCIIDATLFGKISQQFYSSAMLRELNKAYVGFSTRDKTNLAPVATGNWGCGAFNGSIYLKSLLQLMACSAAGRHLVYYTFEKEEFKTDFYQMYTFLETNNVKIKQLWRLLSSFSLPDESEDKILYPYIQQAYLDSRKQLSIKGFFKKSAARPLTSVKSKNVCVGKKYNHLSEQELDMVLLNSAEVMEKVFDEKMVNTDDCSPKNKTVTKNKLISQEQITERLPKTDIGGLIDEIGDISINRKATEHSEDSLVQTDKL